MIVITKLDNGKWMATVDGELIGDKYANAYQASIKVTKYLKGQRT